MDEQNKFECFREKLLIAQHSYAVAKVHAQQLDDLFGYKCVSIEEKLWESKKAKVSDSKQFWIGLDLQSLQTPYSEIVEMVHAWKPLPDDLWIDLGPAYGRLGFVLAALCPAVRFKGYEFISDRADEGNRLFEMYFIYDFGSKDDIYAVLKKLRYLAAKKADSNCR